MKFKIKQSEGVKHQQIVNSIAWTINNEVYSISDDNIIYKWDSNSCQATKFMDLDNFPTDLDWLPIIKGINDVFAIGFIDGSYRIITKLAKVEKVVPDAHKGALIALKWSSDGGALVTAGEDGQIKTWSKTGNLRSSLVQTDKPVYCVIWSPDNESVLYCSDKNLYIKPIQAGQKQVQWKAHDGVVLKCDWNACNNLIVSAGEDCKYRVWDSYGRLLFSSQPYDYVISSVAWAPNGEYFAVGAFEMLKLCDKTGWTYSFNKTHCGSLLKIAWSSDSTIIAGAGGTGSVLFGYVVDKSLNKENWEITLIEDNKIQVVDLLNEINEELDFKDRVINMSLAYENLVVTTSQQCYIYNVHNWNTPHIFDVKEAIILIVQSTKFFCLVQVSNGIMIYNYEGKFISNPKVSGIKFEFLSAKKISISQDVLAVVDGQNTKIVKFFDVVSGKPMNFQLEHQMEINEIHLNQNEVASERKVGYIDINRDLYLSPVHKRDEVLFFIKLSAMTDSFLWNDRNDILIAISDGRLHAWFYPNAIYVDKDLMDICKVSKESNDIGRMAQMLSFSNSIVTLRRKDGGLVTLTISPYPDILFDFCNKQKWEKAIKLCRFVKEQTLWACLAAISLYCRELNTAEIALAAIECIDKVQYINYIKDLPSEISRNAALSMYFHKQGESENTLIQNKLFYRAIKLNIKLFKWERALEIAVNAKTHIDTVVAYRKKYLERINREEWIPKFKEYIEKFGEINWQKIKENIRKDKDNEASK